MCVVLATQPDKRVLPSEPHCNVGFSPPCAATVSHPVGTGGMRSAERAADRRARTALRDALAPWNDSE